MRENFAQKGVPAVLFALPDETTKSNRYEFSIPKLASLYLTHSIDGEVKGIKDFGANHPPVTPIFWAFRVMVGVGLLMVLVSWATSIRFIRGLEISKLLAVSLVAMTFSGWLALEAGWYVTEVGRQPWLVYGILKTNDAASLVSSPNILLTLITYLSLYLVLLCSFIAAIFHLAKKATYKGLNYV